MKKIILIIFISIFSVCTFAQKKVLLIHASYEVSWGVDLKTKLLSTGKFSSIDILNAGDNSIPTPSLSDLLNYDAVLVSSDGSFWDNTNLGNNLASYIDAGGGVVNSVFSINYSLNPSNFYINNYNLISQTGQSQGTRLTLVKTDLTHPILDGVISFNGGDESFTSDGTATISSGSYVIATWNDGRPLVVVNDNIGLSNVKRVDLNFFPLMSSDVRFDGWDATTEGALLIANSLLYVSKISTPTFANANPGPITMCELGSYYLAPSTTDGTWATSTPTVASVNSSGYVTALSTGTTVISLTTAGGTVTATITVNNSNNDVQVIADGQASYKINNTNPLPQGPLGLGSGSVIYMGYNDFNYSSITTPPTNTGYYRANNVNLSTKTAGCPYPFYIFRCTTCPDPIELY